MHVRCDRESVFQRKAMADRYAHRNTKEVAALADGEVDARRQQEVERDVLVRLIQQLPILPAEQELAVAVSVRVGEADVERELRTLRQPLTPLKDRASCPHVRRRRCRS